MKRGCKVYHCRARDSHQHSSPPLGDGELVLEVPDGCSPVRRRHERFPRQLLQHLVIEGLLCHQPLEPGVLSFQRFQPLHLRHRQATVLLLPAIQGGAADAVVMTYVVNAHPGIVLLDDADDLFRTEPTGPHLVLPSRCESISLSLDQFSGSTSEAYCVVQ